MRRVGWLDCRAGASGDMLLGALVGAGVPLAVMQRAVDVVAPRAVTLSAETVSRQGMAATAVRVQTRAETASRRWRDIRRRLEQARIDPRVRERALAAFERLAVAEAIVHGTSPEEVHFHEVGALDALADVVGTAAGLAELGLADLYAGPLAVGTEPAPATLEVLLAAGVPLRAGGAVGEACTPTGAALLAASVTTWDGPPPMRLTATGAGAGSRDPAEIPNVLRLAVGTVHGPATERLVVEANVDDLDPRVWPHVLTTLLAAGAEDAWLTPILMKKGRPAHTVHVLTDPAGAAAVRATLFTHTSTIGLRETTVAKHALPRDVVTVEVEGQPVRVKTSSYEGSITSATPEWEDVVAAAAALGRPVRAILGAASAAAARLHRP